MSVYYMMHSCLKRSKVDTVKSLGVHIDKHLSWSTHIEKLRLLHTMNVRFSLLDIAQRILGVTLPNVQ
jgi:hypothetical protein